MADFYITPVFTVPVRDDPIVIFLTAFSCATDGQMDGYETIEEFNVDSKAECVQLNLAHVEKNI